MFMILKTYIKKEQLFCLKETMKKEHIFSILSNFYGCVCALICFTFIWASLIAQLVKNPPAMQETWVQSLGLEETLEKGKATHSSILGWRNPWTV